MAFGDASKQQTTESTERKWYVDPFLSIKKGVRRFRFLPVDVTNPTQVADEVKALEYWITTANGKKKRVFVKDTWQNPVRQNYLEKLEELWNDGKIDQDEYERSKKKAPLPRQIFLSNVWDTTPIIDLRDVANYEFQIDGKTLLYNQAIVYPNEKNEYVVDTDKGKIKLDPKLKKPRNEVVILMGSGGDPNYGKHLLRKILRATGNVLDIVDDDEDVKQVNLAEVGLKLSIAGEGTDTEYIVTVTTERGVLPDEIINLPRWNLVKYTKPFPDQAVYDLLDGEQWLTVLKAYDIRTIPEHVKEEELDSDEEEELLF